MVDERVIVYGSGRRGMRWIIDNSRDVGETTITHQQAFDVDFGDVLAARIQAYQLMADLVAAKSVLDAVVGDYVEQFQAIYDDADLREHLTAGRPPPGTKLKGERRAEDDPT